MEKRFVIQTSPTCFEVARAFQYGKFVHIRKVEVEPLKPLSEVAVIHLDDEVHRIHKRDLFETMSDAYWAAMDCWKIAMEDIQAMAEKLDDKKAALFHMRHQMKLETD